MRLLVLGGTGRTGRLILELAPKRGHQVVAIARNPERISRFGATIIEGTPYDAGTVAGAMDGCDAVVSLLNVSRVSDGPWAALRAPSDLISKACANALEAMARCGVRRYVTLSAIGAGESWSHLPLIVRLIVRYSNLKYAFDDHTREEELLTRSGVDYTIARAPMLTDKANASGVMAARPGEKVRSAIARRSVAEFFISILEDAQYAGEIIHISNRA